MLYAEPDVYSKPLARLGYGSAVLVQARARFVRIAAQARMHEATPTGDDATPTWMKVQVENLTGWVSARSLSRPLYLAHASSTVPGGPTVLPEASAGAAAADALCAIAAKPPRFDFTAATVFTPGGRLDSLKPIDRPLEKLDAELAKEMATERTDDAAVPGPWEGREPEKSIAGGIHRIIRSTEALAGRGGNEQARTLLAQVKTAAGEGMGDRDRRKLLKLEARLSMAGGAGDEATAKVLEEVIELDPLDGEALMMLGQYHNRGGRPDQAILYFERASRIDSFAANAKVKMAQVFVSQSRFAEALPLLRDAQALRPREDVARYIEQVERASKGRK